jgi:adenine-specific DNA-methyltransferase
MKSQSKYSNFSKEQLISKIEKLEKEKYGLVWEDKEEEVAKQCDIELPVLKEDTDKEILCNPDLSYNYIIEGDNYHSLYTLNFTHKKKI